MPLPTPSQKEKSGKEGRDLFISRCMGDTEVQRAFKKQEQRLAVCFSQYKKAKQKKETQGSEDEPVWEDYSTDAATIIDY